MTSSLLPLFFFVLSLSCLCEGSKNKIVLENEKLGAPLEEWDISGAGDFSIQGFTTKHRLQDFLFFILDLLC